MFFQQNKIIHSYFCYLRRLAFDQKSQVHPISNSREGWAWVWHRSSSRSRTTILLSDRGCFLWETCLMKTRGFFHPKCQSLNHLLFQKLLSPRTVTIQSNDAFIERHWWVVWGQLSVFSCLLNPVSCQLSVIRNQRFTVSCQKSAVIYSQGPQ